MKSIGKTLLLSLCVVSINVGTIEATCKSILENNPNSPSGVYHLTSWETGAPFKVYCEMGLNGGGYTFLSPRALSVLTDTELQTMFTDKKSFLLRQRKCGGTQPYIVLAQLDQYSSIPLKMGLNNNTGYSNTQNLALLGTPYLYFGFLPKATASAKSAQGLKANGDDVTFRNCDANPNSYFALFPNFQEKSPPNRPDGWDTYAWFRNVMGRARANPSGRVMPPEYFLFTEVHFGGCGVYAQTALPKPCILAMTIGFR